MGGPTTSMPYLAESSRRTCIAFMSLASVTCRSEGHSGGIARGGWRWPESFDNEPDGKTHLPREHERRHANQLRQAIRGSLNRSVRNRRPRLPEINWNRTIISNLKNYQPKYKTVVPEKLIGYGRKRAALKDVILALDQSGSMAHRWSTRASSGR
jgi:hypothetical protein